jgi:hypothetical protein
MYSEIGAHADSAKTRLRAAELLVAADQRDEAEAQLGLALEFFRAAGAEHYVRKGEEVLVVS